MSDETGAAGENPEPEEPTAPTDPGPAGPAGPLRLRTRRPSRGAMVAFIVGAVVVVVVIVVGILSAVGAASTAREQPRRDAAAAVRGYLTAVEQGHAATALRYLSGTAKLDRALLTDAALAASTKAAPMGGIHVVTPTTDATASGTLRVEASFTLGTTPVTARFDLHADTAGTWLITDGTGQVTVPAQGFGGLALRINGVPVAAGAALAAFPGTYSLRTSTSGFTVTGTTAFTVKDSSSTLSLSSAQPQLTAAGLQSYRFAIDKAVKGCISAKTLKDGCGLTLPSKLPDGTTLVDGTVQRSLPTSTLAKLGAVKPIASASDGVKLVADGLGTVDVTVRCVKGGQKGTCQIANGSPTYLNGPAVDMSHRPPSVTWPAP